jgi:tungstate transport system ATP-binding protein
MAQDLIINNLLVQRGERTVLQIDHLTIARGETLAVVGPNGAGKSTFLLALARLLKPTRGQISFNGNPASAESDTSYRRRIGLVMQDPLLFDTSVYENVASGLRFRGIPKHEIEPHVTHWLARFGVLDLKDRRSSALSGGEAQRVSLARAFVLDAELILLDEPFSALDSPTRSRLLDDLQTVLAETSATTVFITHDLSEARRLGHRMAVLLGGKVAQVGAPDEIFSRPATDDVARFVGLL